MERPRSLRERDGQAEKKARDTTHIHQCSAVHFSPAPFSSFTPSPTPDAHTASRTPYTPPSSSFPLPLHAPPVKPLSSSSFLTLSRLLFHQDHR